MKNTINVQFPQTNDIALLVEAGHIYTNEAPSNDHEVSARWGSLLANYFTGVFGARTTKMLFVDNYNPRFEDKPETLDLESYLCSLSDWGFLPDEVIFEADIAAKAQCVVDTLQNETYHAHRNDNGNVVLGKNNILLYHHQSDKYTCALLDACLYVEKLSQVDACITVLHEGFASQQKDTLTILKKLGVDTSLIFPFYYSTVSKTTNPTGTSFVQQAMSLLETITQLSGSMSFENHTSIQVSEYAV